jgi:alpha-D-xyloside xylohydrolase
MQLIKFLLIFPATLAILSTVAYSQTMESKHIFPGIWKFTIGVPEKITPTGTRHFPPAAEAIKILPDVENCPVNVSGSVSSRGTLVSVPLEADEMIYGLGLQFASFQQRAKKKMLRVNADPEMDTGDSHAPVPFYVTNKGYGILIDTSRYVTFYLGNKARKPDNPPAETVDEGSNDGWNGVNPYHRDGFDRAGEVLVEVPRAAGVDVYVFAGPSLREAVQRYNLFSGGGPLPPRWGLGFWYRVQTDYTQEDLLKLAAEFRQRRIPCDVLGLEPHWQTHSYSSSYVWGPRFPDPGAMLQQLEEQNFHVNMWEQPFVHPTSPVYTPLLLYSGNYEVWGGIVPDFLTAEAKKIFADYHAKTHVALGISGFKADECDNSDFTGNWSFPEISRFPSSADGEQMHCLFGLRYQDTILSIFEKRKQRTYGLVRSSGALAAPYPFVLYSDLYDHRRFIHGVAQAGFSGLMWCPEVRDAMDNEDLIRRLQTTVLSPIAMINGWYLRNPPWKQVNRRANNSGNFAEGWEQVEQTCRAIIELRMKLIPYIHAAFVRYHQEGLPPFRALIMDYPDDPNLVTLSDQYMMGDSLLVAPVTAGGPGRRGRFGDNQSSDDSGQSRRNVYLPKGRWFDFWTGKLYQGKQRISIDVPLEQIPIFVKAGIILPLARPTLYADDPASRQLTVLVYGDGTIPATLYEEDGSINPELTKVELAWESAGKKGSIKRTGSGSGRRYEVSEWKHIQISRNR